MVRVRRGWMGWLAVFVGALLLLPAGEAMAGGPCGEAYGYPGYHNRAVRRFPSGYNTLVVSGSWGSHHRHRDVGYRHTPFRNMVVHRPRARNVVVAPSACSTTLISGPVAESVVINVPNANGSFTPVTLRKDGGAYIGPRGEYYYQQPTVEQLRSVYGLEQG